MIVRAFLCAVIAVVPVVTVAQTVRISGSSSAQGIDLRPFVRDSVLRSSTRAGEGGQRAADGTLVQCLDGSVWCTFLTSGPRQFVRPVVHDLAVAGWGLGEGVAFHAHARVRTPLGDERAWPRMNDAFDLLDGYLEVDRERARVRLGRQWIVGGLGAYNYDGGAALWRRGGWDAEAFGGRALVQGLNESYTSAELGQIDDLPPEDRAWLLGARSRWRGGRGALAGSWLRVIPRDRSGVYAERASVDGTWRAWATRWSAEFAWDVAAGQLNEGRLEARRGVWGGLDVGAQLRRHRPFFELWTIWGAFAPVGFDEGRLTVRRGWAGGRVSGAVSGAWRRYQDPGTGLASVPLRTDGWRVLVEGDWAPTSQWGVTGRYAADIGVGSSQSDASLDLLRQWGTRLGVGVTASATQTIWEYRVGTGRIHGVAAWASLAVSPDLRLRGDAGSYRHRSTNDALGRDWSQRRASLRLEWAVGRDPGGRL